MQAPTVGALGDVAGAWMHRSDGLQDIGMPRSQDAKEGRPTECSR